MFNHCLQKAINFGKKLKNIILAFHERFDKISYLIQKSFKLTLQYIFNVLYFLNRFFHLIICF